MFDLNSISIKNLRSLKDTGEIDIKPITILVGKNSVGKSTFLRTFPLLRQSCEKKTRSPILWYGNLVDFGDFQTTINKKASQQQNETYIEFGFKINIEKQLNYYTSLNNHKNFPLDLTMKIKEYNKSSFASNLNLKFLDNNFSLNMNHSQNFEEFTFNGRFYNEEFFKKLGYRIEVSKRRFLSNFKSYKEMKVRVKDKIIDYSQEINIFDSLLINEIKMLSRKNIKDETIDLLIKNIPFSNREEVYKFFSEQVIISGFATNIKKYGFCGEKFCKIYDYYILSKIESLIILLDEGLSSEFSSVRYLEPLRATAQRYYRRQELAIDEIDSKGSNIAMFLDSLNVTEKQSLNRVLNENFNIELNVKRESGHLALTIKTPDIKEDTNLADLGVGYSQILPFIIQLWDINNQRRGSKTKYLGFWGVQQQKNYFVVEQPELHLHPAYQAKIADVIDKILDKSKLNVIIETHSPHLIYRFGELIEENNSNISKDDIQVLIFEEIDGETKIRKSVFDEEGRLQNWPIGFFQP